MRRTPGISKKPWELTPTEIASSIQNAASSDPVRSHRRDAEQHGEPGDRHERGAGGGSCARGRRARGGRGRRGAAGGGPPRSSARLAVGGQRPVASAAEQVRAGPRVRRRDPARARCCGRGRSTAGLSPRGWMSTSWPCRFSRHATCGTRNGPVKRGRTAQVLGAAGVVDEPPEVVVQVGLVLDVAQRRPERRRRARRTAPRARRRRRSPPRRRAAAPRRRSPTPRPRRRGR